MKMALLVLFFFLPLLLAGCVEEADDAIEPSEAEISAPFQAVDESQQSPEKATAEWVGGGIAIAGAYADADAVELGNGKYRLYYAAEPEVPNFNGQVYSAVSSDGRLWSPESGTRMEWATFPSVIKLQDGRFRMYFQNMGVIKSATSSDGLSWNQEPGISVDTANGAGLRLENVAAPTVIKVNDSFVMVYRGTIKERYPGNVPNDNTQLFLWATSSDGLNFYKKGIALDSRNGEFQGLLDGPELVDWDGKIRLYFWSYQGIYHVNYENGGFSNEAALDYPVTEQGLPAPFPENPPSDPTLMKISGSWFMYYGQHTRGIYYATLQE